MSNDKNSGSAETDYVKQGRVSHLTSGFPSGIHTRFKEVKLADITRRKVLGVAAVGGLGLALGKLSPADAHRRRHGKGGGNSTGINNSVNQNVNQGASQNNVAVTGGGNIAQANGSSQKGGNFNSDNDNVDVDANVPINVGGH